MEVIDGFINVEYIKNDPYIDDKGIYVPHFEYTKEGTVPTYSCVITKELFVEAYNKWIVEAQNEKTN